MYTVSVFFQEQKDSAVLFEGLSLEQAKCLSDMCQSGTGNEYSVEVTPPFPVPAPEPEPEPEPAPVAEPAAPPVDNAIFRVVVRNPPAPSRYTALGLEIGPIPDSADKTVCAFGTVNRQNLDLLKSWHDWRSVPASGIIMFNEFGG